MTLIRLSDPDVFIDYFEDIAKKTKLLNHNEDEPHYYPADIHELADGFKVKIESPCLVSMYKDSNFSSGGSITNETVNGILWVIAKEDKEENAKRTVLKLTKEITYQVLAKMDKDKEDAKLIGFDLNKVHIGQVSEVAPGWHGYRIAFPIPVSISSKVCYKAENYNY